MRLLALPGLGLGRRAWAPTLGEVGEPSSVLLLPAYGVPASATDDLRPRALAERVAAGLPSAGPVALLGHSASCQVAAHVALLAPEAVSCLVLVGPTTDPRSPSWPGLGRRWLATARRETPRQVPALIRHYRRTTLRSMARGMEAARHDRIDGTLADVRAPVLVVRGAHDRICPADWAALLAGPSGRGNRAVGLAAGAHMVPLTHGPALAEVVRDFLADRG